MKAQGGFLDRLSPEDQAALLAVGRPWGYRRDAIAFREGEGGAFALLITAGRAKVMAVASNGIEIVLSYGDAATWSVRWRSSTM